MAITDKQVAGAMEIIKNYCKVSECIKCPFLYKVGNDQHCKFSRAELPQYWRIPSFSRWTKSDKMFAAAFKEVDINTVTRYSDARLILKTNRGDTVDMGPLLFVFRGLNTGEVISLDEIINSKGEREDD